MIIQSHRGYWLSADEKNSEIAFRRSFQHDFGTETDVRDSMGELVISHDTPRGGEMLFQAFLDLASTKNLLLSINIKADGLAKPISEAMKPFDRSRWFVFDMSIPDMRAHLQTGNPVFARMSEVEQHVPWLDHIDGIWLDSFEKEWFGCALIQNLLQHGKRVCVVSPELHGRDPLKLWNTLLPLAHDNRLILCTDLPERAREYFTGVPT